MNFFTPSIGSMSVEKTLELLWARMRRRGDLPGFSRVVGAIVEIMRSDTDREINMTRLVLQDPALTQKVLRLANSAMYAVFGGVHTVSKAVTVLGTEAVGHLALGLKLLDGLTPVSSESENTRAEMERAVLSGHIARQITGIVGVDDAEEAVVCSVMHTLGRMMTTFYLPDRWQQIQERMAASGDDEDTVARELLGADLGEIGRRVARHWGFPDTLIDTMRDVHPVEVCEPLGHQDWLAAISTLSSRCAYALQQQEGTGSTEALSDLADSYADMLGMEAGQLVEAALVARVAAAEADAALVRPVRRSMPSPEPAAVRINESAAVLTRGVADMRDALRRASADQMLSMALETVYQGLGCSRSIVFLRDTAQAQYIAYMGFGDDAQELLPKLRFGDAYEPDVFHAALANDKMIYVENAQDAAFAAKLPRWWRDALPEVRGFAVLPLTANRRPLGFLYGDWDFFKPLARIEQAEIAPLNELRKLVVQVVERQRREEPLLRPRRFF